MKRAWCNNMPDWPEPLQPSLQLSIERARRMHEQLAIREPHDRGTSVQIHPAITNLVQAYPRAQLWLCPGLRQKRRDLPQGRELSDEPPPAWQDELDQLVIRGNRVIREVLFFDRRSRTLIATDSVENHGDGTPRVPWLLKLWWRIFGLWNRPALAPEYGLGWRDRAAAGRSFERALQWDFDRILLSHGDLIEKDGRALAERAWRRLLDN